MLFLAPDPIQSPQLQYIGLVKPNLWSSEDIYLNEITLDLDWFISTSEFITLESVNLLDGVSLISINADLLPRLLGIQEVSMELERIPFMEKNTKEYLKQKHTLIIKQNEEIQKFLASDQNSSEDINLTKVTFTPQEIAKHNKNKESSSDLTNIATYLVIGGIIGLLMNKFIKSDGPDSYTDRRKIILARRKRWLKKILDLGIIDRKTYRTLLKNVDDLPHLSALHGLNYQSEETSLEEPGEKDLSKPKSGESVVSIKDISDVKTSR